MGLSLEQLRQHCSQDVIELNGDIFGAPSDSRCAPKRKNKYNAQKVNFEGEVFDSAKELRRYQELQFLQVVQAISHLRRQVEYELQPAIIDGNGKKQRAITYTADFVYVRDGKTIIEDVKSSATAKSESFRVRWRMLLNLFKGDKAVECVILDS